MHLASDVTHLYILQEFRGNFFFKVSTLPKPLAADLVPWQLCAAHRACEQLVRQCLGFPTRSNDDSTTTTSRHHHVTPSSEAEAELGSSIEVGGWWWLGGQGWDFFPGFFVGGESMAVRHPFYKTRLCNNFVMTLVSTVFSLSRFHWPKWKVLKVGLKPSGPTRRLLTWRQMCPGGRKFHTLHLGDISFSQLRCIGLCSWTRRVAKINSTTRFHPSTNEPWTLFKPTHNQPIQGNHKQT